MRAFGPGATSELSDRELARIVRLVYERCGITLHAGSGRWCSRACRSGCAPAASRPSATTWHVEADASGDEMTALLDAIATNHTPLLPRAAALRVPAIDRRAGARRRAPVRVWSAACSTGEEPVTIAITLLDALEAQLSARIRLLASDLSTKALGVAAAGVYKMERVAGMPLDMLRRHFERGLGPQAGLARVAAHVRRLIEFRQLNLLEAGDLGEPFDFIFCRNVMIYFDRDVQQRVVRCSSGTWRPAAICSSRTPRA